MTALVEQAIAKLKTRPISEQDSIDLEYIRHIRDRIMAYVRSSLQWHTLDREFS